MASDFVYDLGDSAPTQGDIHAAVGPPWMLAGLASFLVVIQLVALVPASTLWHVIGYGFGLLLVPLTVFAFRRTDRTRQRSGAYAAPAMARWIAPSILIASVTLAVLHAYYLALHRTLA